MAHQRCEGVRAPVRGVRQPAAAHCLADILGPGAPPSADDVPTSSRRRSVAVYGATGHTGRFVIAELLRRGLEPVAVARDGAKLAGSDLSARGVATRAASIDDAAALDHAFAGVAAVINCAGPFLDTAAAVAEAALRAGIHYLDVTAEQASAQATFEQCGDGALAADLVVLPAMSFYGGLADLLATAALGDWDFADQIEVAVGLDSWRPTPVSPAVETPPSG